METPRAEAPQLKPLGVGDIVDRVFALYRSRPLLFLALSAVPYLALVLIIVVLTVATGLTSGLFDVFTQLAAGEAPDPETLAPLLASLAAFAVVVTIVAVVILSAQSAALIDATSSLYLGRPVTFETAFRSGVRAAPRVIGAGLLLFLGMVLAWAVLAVVMVLSNQVLVVLVLTLGGLVGTVFILTGTLVTPVAATIEGAGPVGALQRSWTLSEGNRWRILGLQFLLIVLNAVISTLLSAVFVGALIGDENVRAALQQIVNLVANVAWAPVQWATFAVLYYDLRVRREAFDLQLAAESMPR